MTLEQLRIFIAVAEREHVTRAAESLGLTQSAVSAAIQALEQRYATQLFHRVGRRIELSEAGRLFLEEAKGVLARSTAAETMLSDIGGLKRGTLRVEASLTVASYWLPRRLVAYHALYPDIEIRVNVCNTSQVATAILNGESDLGFVEGQIDEPSLETEVIAQDHLVIVAHPSHPWLAFKAFPPKVLLSEPWVLREPGSGTRSEFEHALELLGVDARDLKVAVVLPVNEAVLGAVEAGAGVAALSELVAKRSLAIGAVKKVGLTLPARPFHAVSHRERYRTRAADALMELIRSEPTRSGFNTDLRVKNSLNKIAANSNRGKIDSPILLKTRSNQLAKNKKLKET